MNDLNRSDNALMRYGTAVLSVMLSSIACLLFQQATGVLPLTLFFPAVIISLFLGGIAPGYVSAALSAVASLMLLSLSPEGLAFSDVMRVVFALVGFIMVCMLIQFREKMVKDSMSELNAAMTAATDGAVRLQPNGRIVSANDFFIELIGSSPEGVRNRPVSELVVAEDCDLLKNAMKRCWEEGKAEVEARILWRGAAPYDVHFRFIRSNNVKGRPASVYCFIRDIGKRKQELEELRQSRERLEVAFRHSIVGMAVADTDGRLLEVNPALCEIIGYHVEELVGRLGRSFMHPDDVPAEIERLRELLAGKAEHVVAEKRYFARSGEVVLVRTTTEAVHDNDGKPSYFISQVQELSREPQA